MGAEILLYGYGIVCLSMLVFNVLYGLHLRSDGRRMDAKTESIRRRVMEQLELKIPTGVLNRVIMDAFEGHTPPVVGAAPLKLFYASMIGMTPPRILLFVNNPKYCADNYLAFLRNVVRNAFDLSGLPIEIELRERPKRS